MLPLRMAKGLDLSLMKENPFLKLENRLIMSLNDVLLVFAKYGLRRRFGKMQDTALLQNRL